MQNAFFTLLALLIVAGFYGYGKNPEACRRLGSDLKTDLSAIYLPDRSGSAPPSAPGATNSTENITALTPAATVVTAVSPSTPVAVVAPSSTPAAVVTPISPTTPAAIVTPASPPSPPTAPASLAPPPNPPPAPAVALTPAAPIPPSQPMMSNAPMHPEEFSDYDEALTAAKQKHKLLLLYFSSPDANEFSQALDNEVVSTPEFQHFAAVNFILVGMVFSRNPPLDPRDGVANDAVKGKFRVGTFPSFLVVNQDGKELGRMSGYHPGTGPKPVISQLQQYVLSAH